MKKKLLLLLCIVFLLTSCQQNFENNDLQKKSERGNSYAVKKILILAKAGEVKGNVLDALINRLKNNYFIRVDDLDEIHDYSFYDYNAVVFIESPEEKGFVRAEAYLNNYGGVNNIIFVGVIPPEIAQKTIKKYRQKFKVEAFLIDDSSAEKIKEITEKVRGK